MREMAILVFISLVTAEYKAQAKANFTGMMFHQAEYLNM
jgi:hypothetical protein